MIYTKVLLKGLVLAFCLTVSLQIKYSTQLLFNFCIVAKCRPEVTGKDTSTIGNNTVGCSKRPNNFINEKFK